MMRGNLRMKRALALAVIVIGIAAIVFWVLNLGPHGDPKPSVTDWVSAVGQAVGAIGTAGALWLGAVTFQRQVRDQHRAQAATVTIHNALRYLDKNGHIITVTLGSKLPISSVEIKCFDSKGKFLNAFVAQVVVDKFEQRVSRDFKIAESCVIFTDSAGTRWERWTNGKLIEIGPEPEGYDIVQKYVAP